MNVFRKENRRRILFTLTLTLLTAALSFGFASRAVEYLAIRQELARISEHYRPIGWLTSDNDGTVDAGVELVSKSPYVETADTRGFLWGTLTDLYNADLEGTYDWIRSFDVYNAEVLFWGVLESVEEDWQEREHFWDTIRVDGTRLTFSVSERINGYPDYAPEGEEISLVFTDGMVEEGGWELPELTVGQRYLVRAYYGRDRNGAWNGYELWENTQGYALTPMPVQGNRLFLTEAEGNGVLPALLADERMQLDEINRHAMWVIATRDMSSMPNAQDSQKRMFLTEGRWPDRVDDRTGAAVCAVHKDFAGARGLQVGDTLELTFRQAQSCIYAYAFGEQDISGWKTYDSETREYTIIGIFDYMPLNEHMHNDSKETLEIYIPYGSAPEAYIRSMKISPHYFSFVLKPPQDTDAFLSEVQEPLAEMGMRIQLLENDWESFAVPARAMEQASRNGMLVSAGVLLLGFTLIAFLYGRQNRKSFGIARSLGVSAGKCVRMCLAPMLLISVFGTGAGVLVSWRYALGEAEKLLAGMQEHEEAGVSVWWLAGILAASAALLLAETTVSVFLLVCRPILVLLQGGSGRGGKPKNFRTGSPERAGDPAGPKDAGIDAGQGGEEEIPGRGRQKAEATQPRAGRSLPSESESQMVKAGQLSQPLKMGRGTASVCRFILRHMRRKPVQTTLTVAVALAFFAAITWMQTAIVRDTAEVERLYETTEIDGELVKKDFVDIGFGGGYLTQDMIDWMAESGYFCDLYTEAADEVRVEQREIDPKTGDILSTRVIGQYVPIRLPEDIERFCAENAVAVDYAKGYDADLFIREWRKWIPEVNKMTLKENAPIIVPEEWLEQYDLEYGQELTISGGGNYGIDDNFIMNITIAGTLRSVDRGDGIIRAGWDKILIPPSLWEMFRKNEDWLYSTVRFTVDPAFNRELDTVKEEIARQLGSPLMAKQDAEVMLWTSELRQVVEPFEKNLELMKLLFPVTTAVSVLAGGGLIFLLLLQRTEEAALLRVLGNSRGRTRRMLLAEPVLLSLAGLLIGICVAYCGFPEIPAAQIGMFAGAYLGGCILGAILGVVHITRKMPLELLQVKE